MKDNRDPQLVGETLLLELDEISKVDPSVTASQAADRLIRYMIRDARDPDPVTRYPTVGELVVETSYRRLPIERLAEVPAPPRHPREGMRG